MGEIILVVVQKVTVKGHVNDIMQSFFLQNYQKNINSQKILFKHQVNHMTSEIDMKFIF